MVAPTPIMKIAAVIWVLLWLDAPGGTRDLSASGYIFNSLEECQVAAANPPAPGQFACTIQSVPDTR